jgi:hypothetical protein
VLASPSPMPRCGKRYSMTTTVTTSEAPVEAIGTHDEYDDDVLSSASLFTLVSAGASLAVPRGSGTRGSGLPAPCVPLTGTSFFTSLSLGRSFLVFFLLSFLLLSFAPAATVGKGWSAITTADKDESVTSGESNRQLLAVSKDASTARGAQGRRATVAITCAAEGARQVSANVTCHIDAAACKANATCRIDAAACKAVRDWQKLHRNLQEE